MGHPLPGRRLVHQNRPLIIKPPVSTSAQKPLRRKPKKKIVPERLPDKSEFHVRYDAVAKGWVGFIQVPGAPLFHGESRTVFTLLSSLDSKYRAWARNQKILKNGGGQLAKDGV